MQLMTLEPTLDQTRRASWAAPAIPGSCPSWIPVASSPAPSAPVVEAVEAVEEKPAPRPSLAPRLSVLPTIHDREAEYTDEIERLSAELGRLRGELTASHEALSRLRGDVLRETEGDVVRLAASIAERILGREVSVAPEIVRAWATEGLAVLGGGPVDVLVSPELADALREVAELRVSVDAALPPGSCVLRGPDARFDVSVRSQLGNVLDRTGT